MLGLAPLPRSFDAALRDVQDQKGQVRLSAVHDLARHATTEEGGRAVAALIAALESDVSGQVRGAAAIALADAQARGGVDALLGAADDSHLHVRQMALIALGELGDRSDERVLDVVRQALRHDAPALRFQALIAASRLEASFAEEALLAATRDEDDEVRHVSFRLLEERATTSDLEVRPGRPVLAAAARGLADPELSVRLAAAILLGRAGDPSGARVIVEGVGARGARLDPEDEQAAIVLAGDLRLREAAPGLSLRAWGRLGFGRSRFAYEARIALAQMDDARARSAILRGLDAWTRDARTLAVVAAGRAKLPEARAAIQAMRDDDSRAEPGAVREALAALDGLP